MKKRIASIVLAIFLCFSCTLSVFADNYSYTIISPRVSTSGVTYCDNLLVSIKVAQNQSIRVTLYNYPKFSANGTLTSITADTLSQKKAATASSTFKSGNQINFFTSQVNNIAPGLYSIKVDVLNANGTVASSENNYFIVKSAGSAGSSNLFETQPSTTMQFFQGLFKSLFGVVE